MRPFEYRDKVLFCEDLPLNVLADRVGTPFYVYNRNKIEQNYDRIVNALSGTDHLVCYALKANANIELVRILAEKGCGADVVSGGELACALRAGIPPEKIVFAGVGKTDEEIRQAIQSDILSIHVESEAEILIVDEIAAEMKRKARIALRINPNVDAKTHPYITTGLKKNKFGIPWKRVEQTFDLACTLDHVSVEGIHCHIGSMIKSAEPFIQAAESLAEMVEILSAKGILLKNVDIGGGLGVDYEHIVKENPDEGDEPTSIVAPDHLFNAVLPVLQNCGTRFIFEPGRYLVAEAGALITRVTITKEVDEGSYVVVDAGMNDFIRPSLYGAFHQIVTVDQPSATGEEAIIVGPICESTDFFSESRLYPPMKRGDLVAIMGTGAYGHALSSNYNGRPRVPEVLVSGEDFKTIRRRECVEDLWRTVM